MNYKHYRKYKNHSLPASFDALIENITIQSLARLNPFHRRIFARFYIMAPRNEDELEQQAADELHAEIIPGTEIMRDVGSIHFTHATSNPLKTPPSEKTDKPEPSAIGQCKLLQAPASSAKEALSKPTLH
jgi:hypothetical protein